jgi:ParB-like chromosome segregation protein Spo0J
MTAGDTLPKTWRDGIIVHPLADSFPMLPDGELKELAADIEKRGLSESVVFAKVDGKRVLVDGRNRCAACHMVGRTPTSREVVYTGAELEAFILSANVHRRHLSPEDRAKMLQGLIAANPEKSDREIAREAKTDHRAVGRARRKGEATGTIAPVAKRKGKDDRTRKMPAKKAAKPPKEIKPGPKLQAALNGGTDAQQAMEAAAADLGDTINKILDKPSEVSVEQLKAAAGDGNTAGLDEFKECCARLFPTFDKVDLAEVRSHVDRECSKYAAALRSAS